MPDVFIKNSIPSAARRNNWWSTNRSDVVNVQTQLHREVMVPQQTQKKTLENIGTVYALLLENTSSSLDLRSTF